MEIGQRKPVQNYATRRDVDLMARMRRELHERAEALDEVTAERDAALRAVALSRECWSAYYDAVMDSNRRQFDDDDQEVK